MERGEASGRLRWSERGGAARGRGRVERVREGGLGDGARAMVVVLRALPRVPSADSQNPRSSDAFGLQVIQSSIRIFQLVFLDLGLQRDFG